MCLHNTYSIMFSPHRRFIRPRPISSNDPMSALEYRVKEEALLLRFSSDADIRNWFCRFSPSSPFYELENIYVMHTMSCAKMEVIPFNESMKRWNDNIVRWRLEAISYWLQ
jgi:hypothetical protein